MQFFVKESMRRVIQSVFGSSIFGVPGVRRIREIIYCAVLNIEWPTKFISNKVQFYIAHMNVLKSCAGSNKEVGRVKCGNHVAISSNVKIDYTGGVEIGNYVDISEDVRIYTHSHVICPERMSFSSDTIIPSKLTIGDNAWIGAGTIVLPSVDKIGKNVIIGAGSVVTRNIPENVVVAGNPAVIIRELNSDETDSNVR